MRREGYPSGEPSMVMARVRSATLNLVKSQQPRRPLEDAACTFGGSLLKGAKNHNCAALQGKR